MSVGVGVISPQCLLQWAGSALSVCWRRQDLSSESVGLGVIGAQSLLDWGDWCSESVGLGVISPQCLLEWAGFVLCVCCQDGQNYFGTGSRVGLILPFHCDVSSTKSPSIIRIQI